MRTVTEIETNVPAFLGKLWKLVEDPETDDLICWSIVSIYNYYHNVFIVKPKNLSLIQPKCTTQLIILCCQVKMFFFFNFLLLFFFLLYYL